MAKCIKCEVNDTHVSFEKCTECIQKALDKPEVIVNDVLTYINSYRSSCEKSKLYDVCIKHFGDEEIDAAKKAIYDEYPCILGEPTNRIGSRCKSKKDFVLGDIFEAFDELDRKSVIPCCASSNLRSIPRFNPEELNESSMLERLINMEHLLNEHKTRLDENYANITDNRSLIDDNHRSISNVQNEVQTSIKLTHEVNDNLNKLNNDAKDLRNSSNDSNNASYVSALNGNRLTGRGNAVPNVVLDEGSSAVPGAGSNTRDDA